MKRSPGKYTNFSQRYPQCVLGVWDATTVVESVQQVISRHAQYQSIYSSVWLSGGMLKTPSVLASCTAVEWQVGDSRGVPTCCSTLFKASQSQLMRIASNHWGRVLPLPVYSDQSLYVSTCQHLPPAQRFTTASQGCPSQ